MGGRRRMKIEEGAGTPALSRISSRPPMALAALLPMWLVAASLLLSACSTISRPAYPAAPAAAPISGSPGRVVTASWYGSELSGHRTSSGELFNPNELTAASPSLPIGSHVRVTNVSNGRTVVVRINDRGPYARGRS